MTPLKEGRGVRAVEYHRNPLQKETGTLCCSGGVGGVVPCWKGSTEIGPYLPLVQVGAVHSNTKPLESFVVKRVPLKRDRVIRGQTSPLEKERGLEPFMVK